MCKIAPSPVRSRRLPFVPVRQDCTPRAQLRSCQQSLSHDSVGGSLESYHDLIEPSIASDLFGYYSQRSLFVLHGWCFIFNRQRKAMDCGLRVKWQGQGSREQGAEQRLAQYLFRNVSAQFML
jgi:hypothetical protein